MGSTMKTLENQIKKMRNTNNMLMIKLNKILIQLKEDIIDITEARYQIEETLNKEISNQIDFILNDMEETNE